MNSRIEQISEPCQPNLLNMPIIVMGEVLKNLDGPSIFRLRKVCHDLRSSIDEINPELHFDSVTLELPITTFPHEPFFKGIEVLEKYYMEQYKPRTGCSLRWNQENAYKYLQISMEDAEALLKDPKLILNSLSIDLVGKIGNFEIIVGECQNSENIQKKEEDLEKFYESMKSLLGKRDQLLKTKEIRLKVQHLSQAAALLKWTDPNSLKTISIEGGSYCLPIERDLSQLQVLEQWKNAEELKIKMIYILTPVESFASFKTIHVRVAQAPIEKLNEVKEFFARSPKLQNFRIECQNFQNMKNQILSNFGQFDSHNKEMVNSVQVILLERVEVLMEQRTWKWLKDIPGSTEKLQATLNTGSESNIKFSKV